jgi:hypothetical protein
VGLCLSAYVVTAAEEFIGNYVAKERGRRSLGGVADNYGFAFVDNVTVDETGIVRGPFATPTPGFHMELYPFIGDLEETFRSGKELASEVGNEPEGVHVSTKIVNDTGQLISLCRRIELGFIAHQVANAMVGVGERFGEFEKIEVIVDLYRLLRETEAAGNERALPVQFGEQESFLVVPAEVVMDLQSQGALS